MKRTSKVFRQTIRNKGKAYEPILLARKPVMPGETLGISLNMLLESAVQSALVNPALASAWAFYCPYRLVEPTWTDFIIGLSSGTSLPMATTAFTAMGEQGTESRLTLGRRCFKLVYNTFFGDPLSKEAAAYYENVDGDSQLFTGKLSNPTQLIREAYTDDVIPADVTYSAPVDTLSGNAEINMVDFERVRKNTFTTAAQMSVGASYLDYLESQGIAVPNELVGEPEMLGMVQSMVYPTDVRNSGGDPATQQGTKVSYYRAGLKLKTKDKYFPEHGLVFVLGALRPLIAPEAAACYPDDYLAARRDWSNYSSDPWVREQGMYAIGGDPTDVTNRVWMAAGFQTLFGDVRALNGADGVLTIPMTTPDVAKYPSVALDVQTTAHSEWALKTPVDDMPRIS